MYQTKYALTKFSCQAAKKPKINVYIWLLLLLSAGLLHHPRGDIRPTTANNNTLRFHWIEIYIQVFVVFLFFVCCSTCCLLFLILFVFVCRTTSKYTYRPGEYCRGQARAVTGSRKKREKKAIRKRKYKHWCPARRCPLPPDRAYTHTHTLCWGTLLVLLLLLSFVLLLLRFNRPMRLMILNFSYREMCQQCYC